MIRMGRWSGISEILCTVVLYFVVFLIVGNHFDEAWAASNLALLSGTLRTFQAHACDSEELRIECLPETVIDINFAHYGRVSHERICAPGSNHHGNQMNGWNNDDNKTCSDPNALKQIIEKCREQRICRLLTSPETFRVDPCPGTRKYAEVAYKCRPVEFTNRVVCEGERLLLRCRKSEQKIVIYSASFGSTHYEAVECPQMKEGKLEDCQSSYATETVMSSCHGQQKCSLAADVETFGNPGCSQSTRKHLKVIFTCVPHQVLRNLPPVSNEHNGANQEEEAKVYTTSYPGWARNKDYTVPAHLVPETTKRTVTKVNSTYKSEMQSDEISGDSSSGENCTKNQRVVGFITEWISAYKFMSDNKEKLILYVVASVGIGLVLFFLMLAGRLYHLRARRRRAKFSHSPHNGEFLDGDSDLEQTERDERPPSRHSSRISVRRQDSDVQTRTPLTQGDTHNHYYS